jgi:hypothetical protein
MRIVARAQAHQLGGELGWRWRLGGPFSLELGLGGAWTFAASSDLSFEDDPDLAALAEPAFVAGEAFLDDTLRTYVHSAHVSLRAYVDLL